VTDLQRERGRERERFALDDTTAAAMEEDWLDDFFDETGHWRTSPQPWNDPESALEQRHFWETFERCLGRLPAAGGRIFFKREVIGEETETICAEEAISASNCWVILHRARIALRECLERNWFAGEQLGR
jgi:RNA polymerase sigma-70 factor (ECF subfamily)